MSHLATPSEMRVEYLEGGAELKWCLFTKGIRGSIGKIVIDTKSKGVSSTDTASRTVDGWVWVMPEGRTIWLRDLDSHQRVKFYQNGQKRVLVITSVAENSAKGYLSHYQL